MAQLVEHDLAKVGAAGSSPVSRLKTGIMFYMVPFFVVRTKIECYNDFSLQPLLYSDKLNVICNTGKKQRLKYRRQSVR